MELQSNWVDLSIIRGPVRGELRNRIGLVYKIKARPEVEEFMQQQANNAKMLVEAVGDSWVNASPSAPPLEYYDVEVQNGRGYTLNGIVGQPLISNADRLVRNAIGADEMANLAFLRLVGISSNDGVSLGFSGAYSMEYIQRLRVAVPSAVKRFLEDYIVPITINLHIVNKSY